MNYKGKRWKLLRERCLKRYDYKCHECLRYGRTSSGTVAHHIYPASLYPELEYDVNNLVALCEKCHDKMHDRHNDELTEAGKKLQVRFQHKIFLKK